MPKRIFGEPDGARLPKALPVGTLLVAIIKPVLVSCSISASRNASSPAGGLRAVTCVGGVGPHAPDSSTADRFVARRAATEAFPARVTCTNGPAQRVARVHASERLAQPYQGRHILLNESSS